MGTPVLILVEDEANLAAFKDYKADSSSAPAQQSEAAESGSEQQSSSGQSCQAGAFLCMSPSSLCRGRAGNGVA